MKKKTFDLLIIILIAILLLALNQFDLLEASAKFAFIPLLALYYIGKWAGEKLNN